MFGERFRLTGLVEKARLNWISAKKANASQVNSDSWKCVDISTLKQQIMLLWQHWCFAKTRNPLLCAVNTKWHEPCLEPGISLLLSEHFVSITSTSADRTAGSQFVPKGLLAFFWPVLSEGGSLWTDFGHGKADFCSAFAYRQLTCDAATNHYF